MSKSGLIGTALLVGLVACACGGPGDDSSSSPVSPAAAPSSAPAYTPSYAPTTDVYAPALTPAAAGTGYGFGPEIVTVTSVTDGDTFRVGDRRIRVIGIDSCEAGTTGGTAATAAARAALLGSPVTLTSEPGVDRDRYGREVRYVATSAGDFGRSMVPADHTAVYEGGNNASASYLAGLRSLDTGPSACGTPVAAPAPVRSQAASEPRTAAPRTSAPTVAPRPLVRQEPRAAAAPAAPSGAYYKNCSAARAAGAAPLHRGQPGYAAKLDRDGDGVACE